MTARSGTNTAIIPSQYEMHNSVQEAKMPAERFDFHNAEGLQLAALLDRPAAGAHGRAVCALLLLWQSTTGPHGASPDGLKQHGIAVLRFDFTGRGGSEDEFADTTFSSNVDDLVAAADHLRQTLAAPSTLIGPASAEPLCSPPPIASPKRARCDD